MALVERNSILWFFCLGAWFAVTLLNPKKKKHNGWMEYDVKTQKRCLFRSILFRLSKWLGWRNYQSQKARYAHHAQINMALQENYYFQNQISGLITPTKINNSFFFHTTQRKSQIIFLTKPKTKHTHQTQKYSRLSFISI